MYTQTEIALVFELCQTQKELAKAYSRYLDYVAEWHSWSQRQVLYRYVVDRMQELKV